MANVKVRTGGKELVGTTTFFAFEPGETSISIDNITFTFEFATETDAEIGVQYLPVSTTELRIRLINWVGGPFPVTLVDPMKVGTLDHRELFILFSIRKAGDRTNIREITVSFYAGEAVSDGQD